MYCTRAAYTVLGLPVSHSLFRSKYIIYTIYVYPYLFLSTPSPHPQRGACYALCVRDDGDGVESGARAAVTLYGVRAARACVCVCVPARDVGFNSLYKSRPRRRWRRPELLLSTTRFLHTTTPATDFPKTLYIQNKWGRLSTHSVQHTHTHTRTWWLHYNIIHVYKLLYDWNIIDNATALRISCLHIYMEEILRYCWKVKSVSYHSSHYYYYYFVFTSFFRNIVERVSYRS